MHIVYNALMPQFKESLYSVDKVAFVVGLEREVLHTKRITEISINCTCNV